jgi:transposase
VLRIEEIHDADVLRQVAVLLERENQRLHDRLQQLTAELAQLRGQDATAAQVHLEFLKELLAQRERALFGDSSEKRPRSEAGSGAALAPPAPQHGHGPKAQPTLPLVETFHTLPEADRVCPQCGGALTELAGQTEDAEEITVVERQFVLVQHRRQKYRCRCNGCVATAPGPLRLATRPDVRGTRYSPEFAVEVAVSKYLDHAPLERQVRIMRREGLTIDSQTLWDQLATLAGVLQPTYEALGRYVLQSPIVGADETWWRLMERPAAKRWWVWSVTRDDAVVYRILETRSQHAARQILARYTGIVMADGYGAYDALTRAGPGPGITLAHCWAHVRRKFVEAEPHYPEPCRVVLDLIGQLYTVERAVLTRPATAGDDDGARAEILGLRKQLRDERSRPIVREIQKWALSQRVLPESSLGKAIGYLLGLRTGLTRFLDEPRIPLDNNQTERGLRGVVLGRRNHYGSRSRRGTEVAALFYSLIESAKLCGVEPKRYLLLAIRAALADRTAVMLPHDTLAGEWNAVCPPIRHVAN